MVPLDALMPLVGFHPAMCQATVEVWSISGAESTANRMKTQDSSVKVSRGRWPVGNTEFLPVNINQVDPGRLITFKITSKKEPTTCIFKNSSCDVQLSCYLPQPIWPTSEGSKRVCMRIGHDWNPLVDHDPGSFFRTIVMMDHFGIFWANTFNRAPRSSVGPKHVPFLESLTLQSLALLVANATNNQGKLTDLWEIHSWQYGRSHVTTQEVDGAKDSQPSSQKHHHGNAGGTKYHLMDCFSHDFRRLSTSPQKVLLPKLWTFSTFLPLLNAWICRSHVAAGNGYLQTQRDEVKCNEKVSWVVNKLPERKVNLGSAKQVWHGLENTSRLLCFKSVEFTSILWQQMYLAESIFLLPNKDGYIGYLKCSKNPII